MRQTDYSSILAATNYGCSVTESILHFLFPSQVKYLLFIYYLFTFYLLLFIIHHARGGTRGVHPAQLEHDAQHQNTFELHHGAPWHVRRETVRAKDRQHTQDQDPGIRGHQPRSKRQQADHNRVDRALRAHDKQIG